MKILVLCTGNSCRSQIAEGFLRKYLGENHQVYSAGLDPSSVHPLAIRVMAEKGIDISRHTSKHLNGFLNNQFDYVITVCDNAASNCPAFPGNTTRLHWPFDDPATVARNEEEKLIVFQQVRDEIDDKVRDWIAKLSESMES